MDKPDLEPIHDSETSFVHKHGNQWVHVTTFKAAHRILAEGLIAPDKEIKREGHERTWGDQEPSWLTSRDGFVYVANLQKMPLHQVKMMVDLERKIGTDQYVALTVDMSQVNENDLGIDEDHIASQDTLNKAHAAWITYVNETLDLGSDGYSQSRDEGFNSVHVQAETFDDFAKSHPVEAAIIDVHYDNPIGDDYHETLADWAGSFENVDSQTLIDFCAQQGSVSISGNIHPEQLGIHPADIARFQTWLEHNPQPEIAYAPDYLHQNPDQGTLFDHSVGK